MNISGKRTSRLLSLSLTGSMLLGLMTTGVSAVEPAQDQTPQTTKTVTDAILYTVDADGNLEYNVVYEAKVADGVTVTDDQGRRHRLAGRAGCRSGRAGCNAEGTHRHAP